MACRIIATGSSLPQTVVTNSELASHIDTTDEWIVERTGIHQRYIANKDLGETTSTLAIEAARKAIEDANVSTDDIDLIIVATTTPDLSFPSVAIQVQKELGIEQGAAFDISAACTGFIYALKTAHSLLEAGGHNRALVIGAETFSNLVDWTDRNTCILFGDGAGAVIVEKCDDHDSRQGIIGIDIRSNGKYLDLLKTTGGTATTGEPGTTVMKGREVFKHAVSILSDIVSSMKSKYSVENIDWLVPHQANLRIIEATAKHLGLTTEQVVITVDKHANTSAASIPLALDVAVRDARIKSGDTVLLEAFGAGFTWGGALIKW